MSDELRQRAEAAEARVAEMEAVAKELVAIMSGDEDALRRHCEECGEAYEDGDCDGERENEDGRMQRCPVAPYKFRLQRLKKAETRVAELEDEIAGLRAERDRLWECAEGINNVCVYGPGAIARGSAIASRNLNALLGALGIEAGVTVPEPARVTFAEGMYTIEVRQNPDGTLTVAGPAEVVRVTVDDCDEQLDGYGRFALRVKADPGVTRCPWRRGDTIDIVRRKP